LATIDPVMPQNRHEYDLPGHRVAGDRSQWEYVHLAIDDQSHMVFTPHRTGQAWDRCLQGTDPHGALLPLPRRVLRVR